MTVTRFLGFFVAIAALIGLGTSLTSLEAARWGAQQATTRYVAVDGNDWIPQFGADDENDCSDPSAPCETLFHAEDKAISGDTIEVYSGIYEGNAWHSSGASINRDHTIIGVRELRPGVACSQNCDVVITDFVEIFEGAEVIIENIVFDGQGVNRNQNPQVIVRENATISFKNVRFEGYVGKQASLLVSSTGETTLEDCSVQNNAHGVANLNKLVVKNCTFISNGKVGESGGAIYNYGDVDIEDTLFSENVADFGGAIFNTAGKVDVADSTFTENVSQSDGGAIYSESRATGQGRLQITRTIFNKNSARTGGAISATGNSYVGLLQSTFDGNSGTNGGAVDVESINLLDIFDSDFMNNKAIGTEGVGGALMASFSNIEIDEAEFVRNEAFNGGGIYISKQGQENRIQLDSSTFSLNQVSSDGGSVYMLQGRAELTDINVTGSIADTGGETQSEIFHAGTGANDGVEIYDSTLLDNTVVGRTIRTTSADVVVQNSDVRGGVFVSEGDLNVAGSTIRDTTLFSGDGAGIFHDNGNMTIINSHIVNNIAEYGNGGGVYVGANSMTVIFGTLIEGNGIANSEFGSENGGGIYSEGEVMIANSTISGNLAREQGGGIYSAGDAALNFVTITENQADVDSAQLTVALEGGGGGGVFLAGGTFEMKNSVLAGNSDFLDGTVVFEDLGYSPNCGTTIGPFSTSITSGGYNVIGSAQCFVVESTEREDSIGTTNVPVDEKLGPLQDNGGLTQTHIPLSDSPAVDFVSDTAECTGLFVSLDQRAYKRPAGSGCDSGAAERNSTPAIDQSVPLPTATATVEPEPTATTDPAATPKPTSTPGPGQLPLDPTPTIEPTLTANPEGTATAEPTASATPDPAVTQTLTPEPSPQSTVTPQLPQADPAFVYLPIMRR